jgi:formate dehydrogenase subunit gamma
MKNEDTKWDRTEFESIVDGLKDRPGALMLVLHEVQKRLGHIPRESVPIIAHGLNLSRAEVHGVITFYHDFHTQPRGRHVIKVCRAESCQAMGAEALAAHAVKRLGIEFGANTRDGEYTLEPVYCLGNCACSPAVMIDEELHGRVNAERFDSIIASLKGARR